MNTQQKLDRICALVNHRIPDIQHVLEGNNHDQVQSIGDSYISSLQDILDVIGDESDPVEVNGCREQTKEEVLDTMFGDIAMKVSHWSQVDDLTGFIVSEYVEIEVQVVGSTERAINVRIGTRTVWIPRSVIECVEDVGLLIGTTLHVKEWFAIKEKLVPDTASGMPTLLPQRADRSRALLIADGLVTGLRAQLDALRDEIDNPDSTHELVIAEAICECGKCPGNGDYAVLAWHAAQHLESLIVACEKTLAEIAGKS